MIIRTLGQLAALTGATTTADPTTPVGPDVIIDSRQASEGALFVALPGERVDGHDFVEAARARGAAAALVAHPVAAADGPALLVADPTVGGPVGALGRLASAATAELRDLHVVGITGSTGKTSMKDLLGQVLATAGATIAPRNSFNNEIGLPLTALRADADTRFLVLEMGARGLGHIGYLCSLVPPQVAVVLNVGHAHLGEFGTPEVTAQAKGELVAALGRGAAATGRAAVLNADDPLVRGMATRTDAPTTWFAHDHDAGGELAAWAAAVAADDLGRCRFDLMTRRGEHPPERHAVQLRLVGRHHVINAVAAAATALTLGLDPAQVAGALSDAQALSPWRMEVTRHRDDVVVVNDAYNANPESTLAALEALAWMGEHRAPAAAGVQRRVAVLGEMLELGDGAPDAHRTLGEQAARHGVDRLVVAGEHAADVVAGAVGAGMAAGAITTVPDTAGVLALLGDLVRSGDLILIKASRSMHFEDVAARVAELVPTADPGPRESSG